MRIRKYPVSYTHLRKTISKETSDIIKDYMYGVVEEGTGKSAAVEGYAIGGKTGTAEKLPRRNGKYLVSFIGYAPQENPQVVVYVVVNEPNAQGQANSGFATELDVYKRQVQKQSIPEEILYNS